MKHALLITLLFIALSAQQQQADTTEAAVLELRFQALDARLDTEGIAQANHLPERTAGSVMFRAGQYTAKGFNNENLLFNRFNTY